MTRDFDPYESAASRPRRAARDDEAESRRVYDLLDAYAGGLAGLRSKYVATMDIGWLPGHVASRATLSEVQRRVVANAVLEVADRYLQGFADMFGTDLEGGRPAIPPLFVHGDRASGRKLAKLLGGNPEALLRLTGPVLVDAEQAREVFAGTRALGYVPFVQALTACARDGRKPPSISRLLGIPVSPEATLPHLPRPAASALKTRTRPLPPVPLKLPQAKPAVRRVKAAPILPAAEDEDVPTPVPKPRRVREPKVVVPPPVVVEVPEPEMVPHEEVGVLEPPRYLDRMEELASLLDVNPEARQAFGLYVQGELGKRALTWSDTAHVLGYSSRGQFIRLLHGKGYWRMDALLKLPGVLGADDTAFAEASGLLATAA